jgi:sigma-B regulation protein RsbU (phosphoserine phosphatase)
MPIDRINSIMTNKKSWSKVGLGMSGETYLVGQDSLLRNQSRFLIEDRANYLKMIKNMGLSLETINRIDNLNSSIGLQPVITVGTKAALRGESGAQIFPDYRGVSVLSSYKPLKIPGVNWVLMSEIDEDEAFASVNQLSKSILLWFFVLIMVIITIAFWFSKTITRPLETLKIKANELANGKLDLEIKAETKDEIGNLAINFNSMRNSIKNLVGELEDINNNLEEKVAERTLELEQATEKIKTLVEVAADAIIMIDSEQTVLMFNPACESVFGYKADEIIGKSMTKLLPEKSRNIHQSEIDKFKEEKNKSRMLDDRREISGRRKDGTIFPAEASISKMKINDYYYFIAFLRDITEKKAIESRLRLQSTALESAANGIVITDPDGIIRWVNPAFAKLTGYSHDEAIGKNPAILKSGQHEDSFYKKMWDTIKAKNVWHDEVINKRKDGSFYTEEMTITPVLNEKSDINNFVAIKQDVTERKELERKLEEANKRMKGELDIGRDIQMSMLPLIFPAFPDHKEFSVYATLHPAREVGGDFYDFFFLDDSRLCFCVGDVSGKGVPAALFMAVTKTLIKSRSSNDFSTASILSHVNEEMSKDNISSMFVTIFICIMDINTGEMIYTNAGHNPAYLRRTDGNLERLDIRHGPVIGAVDGLDYKENKLNICCGDSILLYTDGVTEAMNEKKTLFSENRLVEFFSTFKSESVEILVDSLVKTVKDFEGKADQADDITVLAFKYLGKPLREKSAIFNITIKNGLPAIVQVNERFNSFADEHGIPKTVSRKMNMVFDELLNNIISYAYQDNKDHDIDVSVELTGNWLGVTISDDGMPFDPFTVHTPDTDLSLEERDIGGLGIHLVKNLMDKFSYKRENNKNILNFVKHIISENNSK